MGFDGGDSNNNLESDRNTHNFCRSGDIPEFKLFKSSTGEYISLESSESIPAWQNNQIFI